MEQPECIVLRRKAEGDLLSAKVICEADRLTGYCVSTRYDNYDPSVEEMKESFEIAKRIVSISESISTDKE